MELPGEILLPLWETMKENGAVSQRQMARLLDTNFDAMHGKIFREQQRLKEQTTLETTINARRNPSPVLFKAAVFDIETMALTSSGLDDYLVCACILPIGTDDVLTYAITFEEDGDDRRLLGDVIEALSEYDILIGHNIAAFDYSWLLSRLAYHDMPLPRKRWLYFDTYQSAKRMGIKADRKSLAFLCDYFGVPFVKTGLYPTTRSFLRSRSQVEFEEALAADIYHCGQDVLANRNLFNVLWPIDRSAANLPFFKK